MIAQIAQLVEQRTENPRVTGSIPVLGTLFYNCMNNAVFFFICGVHFDIICIYYIKNLWGVYDEYE